MIFSTFSLLRSSGKWRVTFLVVQSGSLLTHFFAVRQTTQTVCSKCICRAHTLLLRCGDIPGSPSPSLLPTLAHTWCSPDGLPYIRMGNALGKAFPSVFVKCTEHFRVVLIRNKYYCLWITVITYYSVHIFSVWWMSRICTSVHQTMKIWSYSHWSKTYYWCQTVQGQAVQTWKHSVALYLSWMFYSDLWNSINTL